MTTMPRVLSDVARIEEVLKNIETEMQSLAVQLRTFDQRNVAGVEDLSRLDTLKSNMEQVIVIIFIFIVLFVIAFIFIIITCFVIIVTYH